MVERALPSLAAWDRSVCETGRPAAFPFSFWLLAWLSPATLEPSDRALNSARTREVEVLTRVTASDLVSEPDYGVREEPWRAGGGELAARRRTNVIRRGGPASKRSGTNLSKRLGGICRRIAHPRGCGRAVGGKAARAVRREERP